MESQLNDLFNLSADDLVQEKKQSNTDLFKPSPEKGKEGVYSAVIRFVPWHENPKKSIMKKWTAWLTDPLTEKSRYVDCPSSVGKESLLRTVWNKLNYSESAADQKLAQYFSRRQQFASLIQVIQDKNNPDLEGKILVYTYGVKIHDKIQEKLKPEFGEPHNPFDPFEGKAFHLKITKVGGYNNYDSSKFLDNSQPILIDGNNVEKTNEGMERVIEFLKNNSPDLNKYDYQEWDEETHQFVKDVIKNRIPAGRKIAGIQTGNASAPASDQSMISDDPLEEVNKESGESEETSDLPDISSDNDDLNLDDLEDDDFDTSLYENM